MPDVKRTVKLVTQQDIIPDRDSGVEGYPLRKWSIQIFLVNQDGDEVSAPFDKVIYNLHPSFGSRAKQTFKKPPFKVAEEGWGEFDMDITLCTDGQKDQTITHDLNFRENRYDTKHTITFKNPKGALLEKLALSGPVPGLDDSPAPNGTKKRSAVDDNIKKRKKIDKNIDMDKLADGLQKLGEDDLLQVVQMVHDNKSEESYTRNDVDQGEFHVDLYTLPDNLIKMLWDFTYEKAGPL
ncbi:putative transcription initiation factor subunit [Phaeomoniella chlamydospora]|uniref:Putative transcription initiation factor subunit n=1 Tax=Phaeomoniella chlamydospora TaxID=158046 RepID=A0A0G2F0W2_PHACM|nr:putative transcription initiation factor subunit [Phaeomoniella chlamydospora]